MLLYLIPFTAFLPLILSAVLFTVSLVRFIRAKDQPQVRERRKTLLIAASILLGAVLAAYIGIMVLLALAIRNM